MIPLAPEVSVHPARRPAALKSAVQVAGGPFAPTSFSFGPLPAYARDLDLDPLRWLARYVARSVVVFDLETTTFLRDRNWQFGIIEFGAVVIRPSGQINAVSTLLNPCCRINPAASGKHGIYDANLTGAPLFSAVVEDIRSLFAGAIVAGHYITSFDVPGIQKECRRFGVRPIDIEAFDIRALMPKLQMRFASKKLADVARTLDVDVDVPKHRALPDSLVAAGILAEIVGRIGADRFLAPETPLSRFSRWSRRSTRQFAARRQPKDATCAYRQSVVDRQRSP